MQPRSRNDEEKEKRRETLLNAAQTVFFEKGFEATSMDDIANEAGFSRGLLYVYFKDKKDIYRSLRVRSVETLRDGMHVHVNLEEKGLVRVRQTGEAFYNFYLNEKNLFDCMSLDISLNNQTGSFKENTQHDPDKVKAENETMQIMVSALKAGIKDGSVDASKVPNALQTAMYLRGCLHGVILLLDEGRSTILDQENIDRHTLVTYALDMICDSLQPTA